MTDPFTPAMQEQRRREKQLRDMEFLSHLERHKPTTGFEVLSAVAHCASNGCAPPQWLVLDLMARLNMVRMFEVASLDDPAAFGPLPSLPTGAKQLRTAAIRAKYGFLLNVMFSGQLPRTPNGFAQAGAMLGLTEKQVRSALPKTRSNVKGHKSYGRAISTVSANDPFSLTRPKEPKK